MGNLGIFKLIFKAFFGVFVGLNLGVNLGFGAEFGGNLVLNSNSRTNLTENSAKNTPNLISVSIPPQKYIVEKIAGSTLKINVIIPAGTDEHNLDFKPATMKGLENSAIYFTIGLEIERVFEGKFKSVAKSVEFIDTGAGLRNLKNEHAHENLVNSNGENSQENLANSANLKRKNLENSHGNHAAHSHGENLVNSSGETHADSKDPHIWFDPILLKAQAEIIAAALIKKYPQNEALYKANLAKFQAELDQLHTQLSSILKGAKHKKFIIYHPSLAYFAARYDLTQIPVQIEGKEPKARDLQRLIATAKKEQIQVIFVQKGFSQGAIKTLAKELGAKVLEIDNLSENFAAELLKIARILGD